MKIFSSTIVLLFLCILISSAMRNLEDLKIFRLNKKVESTLSNLTRVQNIILVLF